MTALYHDSTVVIKCGYYFTIPGGTESSMSSF